MGCDASCILEYWSIAAVEKKVKEGNEMKTRIYFDFLRKETPVVSKTTDKKSGEEVRNN